MHPRPQENHYGHMPFLHQRVKGGPYDCAAQILKDIYVVCKMLKEKVQSPLWYCHIGARATDVRITQILPHCHSHCQLRSPLTLLNFSNLSTREWKTQLTFLRE